MAVKFELSIEEKIDRAKDGRKQGWIVAKMNEFLEDKITEVVFSRKKKGFDSFTKEELTALETVLPGFKA